MGVLNDEGGNVGVWNQDGDELVEEVGKPFSPSELGDEVVQT